MVTACLTPVCLPLALALCKSYMLSTYSSADVADQVGSTVVGSLVSSTASALVVRIVLLIPVVGIEQSVLVVDTVPFALVVGMVLPVLLGSIVAAVSWNTAAVVQLVGIVGCCLAFLGCFAAYLTLVAVAAGVALAAVVRTAVAVHFDVAF